jgi:hypothetical protein
MGDWISVPGSLPWWAFGLLLVSVFAQFLRLKPLQPRLIVPLVLLVLISPRLQTSVGEFAASSEHAVLNSPAATFVTRTIAGALPS